ncbi:MAG: hypothetical protein JXJ22_01405 [Bacteroidales bacterium]|nr:hypothetical protein [Bacteroidales bacterium]
MKTNELVIFKLNKGFLIILINVILIIVFAFISYILTYIFRQDNNTLNIIMFFILLIVAFYSTSYIGPKYFKELGHIQVDDSGIRLISLGKMTYLDWNKINFIRFHYRGDLYWRARRKKFQKIKSNYRYSVWIMGSMMDMEFYDSIEINSTKYFIKIRSHSEKDIFFSFYDICRKNINNTELNENYTYQDYLDN